jgi:hypothetical protein
MKHEEYTAFDSDDSDDFEESSIRQMLKGRLDWNDEVEKASDALKTCNDGMGYGMAKPEDKIPSSTSIDNDNECGPKVMFEGPFPEKGLPSVHILETLLQFNPTLKRWNKTCIER